MVLRSSSTSAMRLLAVSWYRSVRGRPSTMRRDMHGVWGSRGTAENGSTSCPFMIVPPLLFAMHCTYAAPQPLFVRAMAPTLVSAANAPVPRPVHVRVTIAECPPVPAGAPGDMLASAASAGAAENEWASASCAWTCGGNSVAGRARLPASGPGGCGARFVPVDSRTGAHVAATAAQITRLAGMRRPQEAEGCALLCSDVSYPFLVPLLAPSLLCLLPLYGCRVALLCVRS